jgi:hypothetical protein
VTQQTLMGKHLLSRVLANTSGMDIEALSVAVLLLLLLPFLLVLMCLLP